ncbi:MAG: ATP-binding cassette domain-containing protein, partial [Prevotella sp.]|nr:ATP-binding cassette domain-containing protein [Prevotella sp.]
MIRLTDISKKYAGSKDDTKALDGVSLEFDEHGLVFIVGKSGCGKTTLLNIIGGIDTPTDGEMVVNGVSFKDCKKKDLDIYRNYHVGFVFQEYNLLGNYTVGKNVSLAVELQGYRAAREKVDEILHRVELTDLNDATLYDRKISELSGGQKQRTAIARALIKNPDIILADEPTGALDSTTGTQLYELLKKLSRDKLIIVVSHDEENAEKYADRIIHLADGKVVEDKFLSAAPYSNTEAVSVVEPVSDNPVTTISSVSDSATDDEVNTMAENTAYDAARATAEDTSDDAAGTAEDITGTSADNAVASDVSYAATENTSVNESGGFAASNASSRHKGKGGLLWTRCISMGAAGFKHKTVRLAITLILAVCFLAIVGFSVAVDTADSLGAELKKAYACGEQTAIITSDSYMTYMNSVAGFSYSDKSEYSYFESEQIETLGEYMPIIKVLKGLDIYSYYRDYYDKKQVPDEVFVNPYNY